MGPCFFAVLMGLSRVLHAKIGEKIRIEHYLGISTIVCVASYLLASLSPVPVLSLIGCGICGFSVGAMWPGTFSLATQVLPKGGTAMFALLALAGDGGCSLGPAIVGFVSASAGDNIKTGLISAVIFPAVMLVIVSVMGRKKRT